MKTYLLKENLKLGLGVVEKIISKSVTLPILESVYISADKNFLTMTATNLESSVIFKILSKIEEEGEALVPAKMLSSIIKSFKSYKINIEKHDNTLIIAGEKEKTQLKCQDSKEFPIIPKVNIQKSFNIDSIAFMSGISQVINTSSTSFNRPELSGIYFNISKNGITAASTDTFRLSEKQLRWSPEHTPDDPGEYSFIVPTKILSDAAQFFWEIGGELNIYLGDGQVILENQDNQQYNIKFISKLIEGDFPNYKEIIPHKFDARAVLNKIDLLSKIRAASVLSPKTSEISLSVLPKQKTLKISSRNPDSGEYQSFLAGQIDGEGLDLEFNWRYLADGLANIKSHEVLLELQKNGGPAAIRPVGDDSYVYVVMPIRST